MPNPDDNASPEKNAERLDAALDELEHLAVLPSFTDLMPIPFQRKRDYPAFWAKEKEVQAMFKLFLRKEDRESLWERKSDLCQKVKKLYQQEQEERHRESEAQKWKIGDLLSKVRNRAASAHFTRELKEIQALRQKAGEMLDSNALTREHQQECWGAWKETGDRIQQQWESICNRNFWPLERKAWDVRAQAKDGNPYDAQKENRELQARAKDADISGDQRTWLWAHLQESWDIASRRIAQDKGQKQAKEAAWRSKQEAARARFKDLIAKKKALIERIEGQIEDLEEKIANARSEEWADQARGWLREKEAFLRQLKDELEELEAKLRSVEDNLDR